MFERMILHRLTLAAPILRYPHIFHATQHVRRQTLRYYSDTQNILQPSFWASLIPKPLRRGALSVEKRKNVKSTEWNPATFFIVILLLIGSMSIQMIALRNDFAAFSRRADAKIELLKEIIEKVQNGEVVDVEGLLGTGDPEKEQEWEEVMKEIEKEDEMWIDARRKKPARALKGAENESSTESNKSELAISANGGERDGSRPKVKSNAPRGFY